MNPLPKLLLAVGGGHGMLPARTGTPLELPNHRGFLPKGLKLSKVSIGYDSTRIELERAFRATWEEQGQRMRDALRMIPEGESVVFLVSRP